MHKTIPPFYGNTCSAAYCLLELELLPFERLDSLSLLDYQQLPILQMIEILLSDDSCVFLHVSLSYFMFGQCC